MLSRPRRLAPKPATLLALVAGVLATASAASAAPHVEGTFPLKAELNANNKIVAGPDGNLWLTVDDATNDVARIKPSGEVTEYDLENVKSPSGIAVGPEGRLWVTQNEGVASFSPVGDPTKTTTTTIAQVKAVSSIVAGPDGQMWVATENLVLHFPPASPASFTPIPIAELSPRDIDVAGSLLAIADANSTEARIVTLTTAGVEKDFAINGGSQGVAGAPTGQIGFSEQVPKSGKQEEVGTITPPNPAQSQLQPDDPFGVAFGSDQAFWIVRAGTNGGLARLTPTGQLSLLGGFPAGQTARQITAGPDNTLWVTTEKNMSPGVVVRVSGLEPPKTTTPAPNTTLAKGPKLFRTHHKTARLRFRFSSPSPGAAFECALTRVSRGKAKAKGAKPRFRACASPRTYRLRPGSYRFEVRAVLNGVADPTPAVRSFRVVRVHRHKHRRH